MAARAFKVWYAADKKLVSATSLDELINKGLTKLHKTRENFKGLRLSDGTAVDDDELFAFLKDSEPIHFVFYDEEVQSTSTCTGASDHQQTSEYGVHSLPSTPITRTPSNVSFLTPPPTPHVTTPGVESLVVGVQQSDMAQSTTTQTHKNFVKASMVGKNVQAMAGIGPIIGKKLEGKGYGKASKVLGKYLMLNQNEELFKQWLKDEVDANEKQGSDCYRCLKEWCDRYL